MTNIAIKTISLENQLMILGKCCEGGPEEFSFRKYVLLPAHFLAKVVSRGLQLPSKHHASASRLHDHRGRGVTKLTHMASG